MNKILGFSLYILLIIFSGPVHSDELETLRRSFAWPLTMNNFDPHNTSSDTIFSLISHYLAPLLTVTPKHDIAPALAESWTVSKDQKMITLHLRKNVKWSDGTPLTALQVKQSISRALSKNMKSDALSLFLPLQGATERLIDKKYNTPLGIDIQNDHQVTFHLTRSYSEFLQVLTLPISSPVPMHLISQDNQYPSVEKLVSSGPYKVISITEHSAKFISNEQYYGPKSYYKNVSFKFSNYKNLTRDFLNNSVDTVEYISIEQMPWLEKHLNDNIRINHNSGIFYLVMTNDNSMDFPAELRSMMMNSLNYERINQLMTRGYFSLVDGLIPWNASAASGNYSIVKENNNAILSKARSYLEKKGFSEKKPKEICIFMRKSSTHTPLFNFLKAYWKNMHINLIQKEFVPEIFLNNINDLNPEKTCPIIVGGHGSRIRSEENIILSFFQGSVYSTFLKSNTKLHKSYKEAIKITEPNLRKIAIKELEKQLIEQSFARTLYRTDVISLVNQKKISNFTEVERNSYIPLSQDLKPAGF